jgi:hypothetical protein
MGRSSLRQKVNLPLEMSDHSERKKIRSVNKLVQDGRQLNERRSGPLSKSIQCMLANDFTFMTSTGRCGPEELVIHGPQSMRRILRQKRFLQKMATRCANGIEKWSQLTKRAVHGQVSSETSILFPCNHRSKIFHLGQVVQEWAKTFGLRRGTRFHCFL